MISVIVPVCNVQDYLEQCIQSIIDQTYLDWECILVDDGSSDNSGTICDTYAEKEKRITAIHQKNQGVSVARNQGIEKSKGEYICFIDSDDWVGADYLTHLVSGMSDEEIDMVICGDIHESSKAEINAPQNKYRLKIGSKYTDLFIKHVGLFYGPCSILYKSSIIKSNSIVFPKDYSFGEDTTFVFSYLRNVRDVVLAPFADYHYRIQVSGTLSYRFGEEKTFQRYNLWKMRQTFYMDKGMWNTISQKNMYRELWAIVYDGIFSTPKPSLSFLCRLLSINEISDLKRWEYLFHVPRYISFGIEQRAYWLFYILCKLK